MPRRILDRANMVLERWLPEQRLFLKSEDATRFVRLRPLTQAVTLFALGMVFLWSVIASSLLFIDGISSGGARDQARIAMAQFETRLDILARERDQRAAEALAAQDRFQMALEQVSQMQSQLLASEERRRELETGINVIQSTLRRTMSERDEARTQLAAAKGTGAQSAATLSAKIGDMGGTVDLLSVALTRTATERDRAARDAESAREEADQAVLERRLIEERNDEIFDTLEGAVQISMEPLDRMFKKAGMDPDDIIAQIRRGYSGTGGPLIPAAISTKGMIDPDEDTARAEGILQRLDEMNLYRIAIDKLPFAMPLRGGYRFTSPFGYRWGRLHAGIDLAGPVGMDVHAPADGVVTEAGWENGYGNVIKLRHQFGVSTVYGHLSKIRVKVGQKVSRGEVIGDTGNTGRSTGPHLHYEIRVGGAPINPMTFIKAAQDVF
ncbi:murein DD-endopeptidase MepM/ murein hydrolase activator NlpD [Rhodobacter aestuarii]|uniref:Murein DD-endopeptidase MepM and murein hydrolase activator NlpD, contain LysM domain n=1 Tax=Rhodobacter aestuarii TaxID=453582 RepID=A0A1N7J7E1_9RHOB|nr:MULTISPECIES: M23 family metallopeptidase [Rhodobacter]PTV97108.1 murein DD-endopeptidase MepM/ murein hydrolase activator NlpD [Rhodobacter aestuarii]SIS45187.1 Murein DD-endopeptidase MepM and murein hydrolase activator NlpD, contain LysM domain [Rhodobacter aestuarii]SOB98535.1 murein DD-endopeptidase MepM/ murein hydrolase activator NlpD [Rhodobacter sp. JA431]